MPQGIKACVPQVLRPHSSRALELQLLSPHVLEPMLYKRSLCTETKESLRTAAKTQHSQNKQTECMISLVCGILKSQTHRNTAIDGYQRMG